MVEENISLDEWEGLFNQLGQVLAEIVKIAPGADLAMILEDKVCRVNLALTTNSTVLQI